MDILRIVAGAGAIVHVGFAIAEMAFWTKGFAVRAARRWTLAGDTAETPGRHILWAKPLAFTVGAYNLALALGLAWLAAKGSGATGALGPFLASWLLAAAAAAGATRVYSAMVVQGALGLALLWLCMGVNAG